jgi:hypothetical protein
MRGAKKDIPFTKLLRANGLLLNRNSFVSLGLEPHLYLSGEDIVQMRARAWNKSRGKCAICKHELNPFDWHMHHVQGGLVGRCDCLHNLQATHPLCHMKEHMRPRFGVAAKPTEDNEVELSSPE